MSFGQQTPGQARVIDPIITEVAPGLRRGTVPLPRYEAGLQLARGEDTPPAARRARLRL